MSDVRGTAGTRRRTLLIGVAALVGLVLVGVIGLWRYGSSTTGTPSATVAIDVTTYLCGPDWTVPPTTGRATLNVHSTSPLGGEAFLESVPAGQIWGETDFFPNVTAPMDVDLAPGRYEFLCLPNGANPSESRVESVSGPALSGTPEPRPFLPITDAQLSGPGSQYRAYVGARLALLQTELAGLAAAEGADNMTAARSDWITAHITYHTIGAAYDAFGALGVTIDGLMPGRAGGDGDTTGTTFTGFHKVEQDLWTDNSMALARSDTAALRTAVGQLVVAFPGDMIDPSLLGLRTHEILEDALRDELTGEDDYGSGSSLASIYGDVQGDRYLLTLLGPLINERSTPGLVSAAMADTATLETDLLATRTSAGAWVAVESLPLATRQQLDADLDACVETLAPVADLLEVRPSINDLPRT